MPKKDRYDLIVVGAGPGGSACAITAARLGLDVLLVERSEVPGQKNMSGAVLFTPISTEIYPNFMSAPFMEGATTLAQIAVKWTLDNDEHEVLVGLSPGSDVMTGMPVIDRVETDKWMAEQAVTAGAEPLYSTRVDNVVWDFDGPEGPRVVGIVTEKGEKIYSSAIADCSGIDSVIASRSGLVPGHDWKKSMIAAKVVYKLDKDEIWERFGFWTGKDGRPACDWGVTPVYFGNNPEFFSAHFAADYHAGVIEMTIYECVDEMVKSRTNIWQRVDWFEQTGKNFLKGAERVRVNFHPLNCFDAIGYDAIRSYLPGLVLVGDAASCANPVESWGANVAQWQGRMFAQLVAAMKKDNDWSKARFAEYETRWQNDWVGDDTHLIDLTQMFRNGKFGVFMTSLDAMVARAVWGKIQCEPYSKLIPAGIAKMLPEMVPLLAPSFLQDAARHGLEKLAPVMAIAQKIKD